MTTITATASGGTRNWSDTATWSPAQVPTAADDVVLASTSGNVTIDATANCRSLDCQASGNYAGTLTANNVILNIGDATPGAGNRALRFSSAMTASFVSGATVVFKSTSATAQTITTAGKSHCFLTFSPASGGSWLFADSFTATNAVLHTAGTLDFGSGLNHQCASFNSSNSNTRTLTLGSSTITLTATTGNAWTTTTTTGLTVTANTATLALAGGVAGGGLTVDLGSFNWNGLSINYTGAGTCYLVGAATVANFTRTGTAAKTNYLRLYNNLTVTGTFTVASNSDANPVLVHGDTLGMPRTITAANVVLTNRVDFMDVAGAGAGSWTGSKVGDAGGNSGITFTASVTRYGVVAGNWSSTATWSATSGGAGGASVPLPQDDVILDASSAAGTYTIDMPRACRNLTCTGFTRTLSIPIGFMTFGSLTLGSGMTLSGSSVWELRGRGSHTITSAGVTVSAYVTINGPGATYTLQDAFATANTFHPRNTATLNTAGYNVTCSAFQPTDGIAKTINTSGSIFTLTGTGNVWYLDSAVTLNGAPSIVLSDTSAATKTLQGAGKVYGSVTPQGGATNAVAVTGANTWDRIDAPGGCVLTFPASTTQTFTGPGIVSTGTARNYIRFPGTGSFAHYLSVPDAAAFDVLGDAEWQLGWGPDDWTPSSPQDWVGRTATDPNRAWLIRLQTNGTIRLTWYPTGSSASSISASSTVAVPFTDGARGDAKITLDVDNGASGWTVKFYTSADGGATWSQLGADVTGAGVTSLPNVTQAVTVNTNNGASDASGNFYRFIFRSGIGGSAVLDIDPANKPFGQDSWTCATGQTVTVNGDLAQAGDGRVLINSATPGTAATLSKASGTVETDYVTLKDSTATGGATWNAGVHSVAKTGVTGWNMTGTISKYAYCPVAAVPRAPIAKTANVGARAHAAATTRGPIAKTASITATTPAAAATRAPVAKTANISARAHAAIGTSAAPNKTVTVTARTPVGVTVTAATYGPTVGCITLAVSAACPGPLRVRGSAMTITATVQRAGHLFDPETLTLNVRKPDGTRLALPKSSAGRESSGVYTWEIDLDQAGNWIAEAVAAGHVEAATDLPAFHVAAAGLS